MYKHIALVSLFFLYSFNFCMDFSNVRFADTSTVKIYTAAINGGGTIVAGFNTQGPKPSKKHLIYN